MVGSKPVGCVFNRESHMVIRTQTCRDYVIMQVNKIKLGNHQNQKICIVSSLISFKKMCDLPKSPNELHSTVILDKRERYDNLLNILYFHWMQGLNYTRQESQIQAILCVYKPSKMKQKRGGRMQKHFHTPSSHKSTILR